MKRIIICADGTWNQPDQTRRSEIRKPSNVVKTVRAVLPLASDGIDQIVFYDQGIGTESSWSDKLLGGAFGKGLVKNILDCYRFIVHNYQEGDEIYLFGFSRGAYTVRSLAGMIGRCGLLIKSDAYYIPEAFEHYRLKQNRPWNKEKIAQFRSGEHSEYRNSPVLDTDIQFIGVWDTVGALGIPGALSLSIRKDFNFHDVQLGENVKHGYHALAIDEKRKPFTPTLWEGLDYPDQTIEQVWFAGAHENIGGGHDNDGLANCAFQWMLDKAEACGLQFDQAYTKMYRAYPKDEIHDPYSSIFRIFGKHVRPIGQQKNGHESVHKTAIKRLKARKPPKWEYGGPYKPKNLIAYLEKKEEDKVLV